MKKKLAVGLYALIAVSFIIACGRNSSAPTTTISVAETVETESVALGETAEDSIDAGSYETASGWPKKQPITLVVPAGAGGTMDLASRLVATQLEKELGATVVVENVPGGGMWIAWKQVLASKPDGYTVTVYNCPTVAIANYNEANPQEEGPDDFVKLCNFNVDYGALAIRTDDDRFFDLDSLVQYAKNNPLICTAGARGLANGDASSAEWFNKKYGTQFDVMTVDSSSDGMARFLAGDTDCFFGSIGDLIGDIDSGKYKVVGIFSEERSELMPDIPTLKEQGYDYQNFSARGFAFPAGVDQDIVDNMTKALVKSCEAVSDQVLDLGLQTQVITGDDYETFEDDLLEQRLDIYGLTKDDKVVGK